jgi:hypothetical protein
MINSVESLTKTFTPVGPKAGGSSGTKPPSSFNTPPSKETHDNLRKVTEG